MLSYLEYIGMYNVSHSEMKRETYTETKDENLAKKYLEYLRSLNSQQNDRQQTIESKNSQLVGQASIVISIVAIFIPLFIDKFDDFSIYLKGFMMFAFIFLILHYFLTIIHSIRTYEIAKYPYSAGATSSVTKIDRKDKELDFINEEIKDLVYIINNNIVQNNKKGANLIYASRCFKLANFYFLGFTIILVFLTFNKQPKKNEVRITNINEINASLYKDSAKRNHEVSRYDTMFNHINAQINLTDKTLDSISLRLNVLIKDYEKPKVTKKKRKKQPCP